MNALFSLLGSELCRNLVTALAHTLWLGALVACLLYAYLRTTPAEATNKRYWATVISLIAIVLGGLLAWSVLNYEPQIPRQAAGQAAMDAPRAKSASKDTQATEPAAQEKITTARTTPPTESVDWHLWAAGAWLVGVTLMLLRTMAIVVGAGRLRRRCVPVEDHTILAMVEQLRRQMRIGRRIRVVAGEHLSVPGVVGCLWPTLLLPVAMVSGMPADDLRAILAHELAHIRRFDAHLLRCQLRPELRCGRDRPGRSQDPIRRGPRFLGTATAGSTFHSNRGNRQSCRR